MEFFFFFFNFHELFSFLKINLFFVLKKEDGGKPEKLDVPLTGGDEKPKIKPKEFKSLAKHRSRRETKSNTNYSNQLFVTGSDDDADENDRIEVSISTTPKKKSIPNEKENQEEASNEKKEEKENSDPLSPSTSETSEKATTSIPSDSTTNITNTYTNEESNKTIENEKSSEKKSTKKKTESKKKSKKSEDDDDGDEFKAGEV